MHVRRCVCIFLFIEIIIDSVLSLNLFSNVKQDTMIIDYMPSFEFNNYIELIWNLNQIGIVVKNLE